MLKMKLDSSYIYDVLSEVDSFNLDFIVDDLIKLSELYKNMNKINSFDNYGQLSESLKHSDRLKKNYSYIDYNKSIYYDVYKKKMSFNSSSNNTILLDKIIIKFINKTSLTTLGKYTVDFSDGEIDKNTFIDKVTRNIKLRMRKCLSNKFSVDYTTTFQDVLNGDDLLTELTNISDINLYRTNFDIEQASKDDLLQYHQFIENNLSDVILIPGYSSKSSVIKFYYKLSDYLNLPINKDSISNIISDNCDLLNYINVINIKHLQESDILDNLSFFNTSYASYKQVCLLTHVYGQDSVLITDEFVSTYDNEKINTNYSVLITDSYFKETIRSKYTDSYDLSNVTIYLENYEENIDKLNTYNSNCDLGLNVPGLEKFKNAKAIKNSCNLNSLIIEDFYNYKILKNS